MADGYAVYDTVWDRFVGGVSADETAQQTIADDLTESTGRTHTVVQVEEDDGSGSTSDFRDTDVANLIALAVAGDTTSNEVHATLVADDRYGELPAWCEDVGSGNFRLWLDAGSVAIVALDVCTIDFSATTPAEDPGTINAQVTVKLDGSQITTGQNTDPGDGNDSQLIRAIAVDQFGGGVMSILVASVASDAESAPITDAVTSHDVYVKLTREAYSPVEIS